MGKHTGFIEFTREEPTKRLVNQRIKDYHEFEQMLSSDRITNQAARCMDCGVPFCHAHGCPTQNRIPDWNDMVYRNKWREALDLLHSTDNFPEFTGRICPAPCEAACTLGINQPAVTIRHIELQIIERGWKEGWIKPEPANFKSGKRVAVIGSGPAGMAAAQQSARNGHETILFERSNKLGGILRYGIPDFKLEKWVIDRRLEQLEQEGVKFETSVDIGVDMSAKYLQRTFDIIVITTGSTVPRDLPIPGRELQGIHFAMDFLTQQNKRNAGEKFQKDQEIIAKNKNVLVIGGGDTGSDCVGTSIRQNAVNIKQIELLSKPPLKRASNNPWPEWPTILRTSSSHDEGCDREWSILTKEFIGKENVEKVKAVKIDWSKPDTNGRRTFKEIPGSDFEIKADLVLLAMGFIHVEHGPLVSDLGLKRNDRGDIITDDKQMTSIPGVFAAGDCVKGASLVVTAINQGRKVAEGIERYLNGI